MTPEQRLEAAASLLRERVGHDWGCFYKLDTAKLLVLDLLTAYYPEFWSAMRNAQLEAESDIAAGLEALKEPEAEDWDSIKARLDLTPKSE